jgi:hypothetical protein
VGRLAIVVAPDRKRFALSDASCAIPAMLPLRGVATSSDTAARSSEEVLDRRS